VDILFFNVSWMAFNIYLALLPIVFLWLSFLLRRKIYKLIFGFLWLIYLPNSIYVFADLSHLIEQWPEVTGIFERMLLVLEYAVLEFIGLTAFIYALHPIEKLLKERLDFKTKNARTIGIIGINQVLGFCMTVGRVERVNSWDILVATDKVILAFVHVLTSLELVVLSILLGLFANFFYFLFRKQVMEALHDI
jgi:uncharacterized membrane protein